MATRVTISSNMNIIMKNFGLLLLPFVFALSGCGGEAGKSTTSLEVSRGFAMTNPSFGGGLVILAENSAGKKVSISLDSSLSKNITLENGSWNFYAYGWDGGANNYNFTGTPYCGIKKQVLLQGQPVSVNLTVTSAACTNAELVAETAPKDVWITACGAFYNYNAATNTFGTAPTLETYCSGLPHEYKNNFTHLKIDSVDTSGTGLSSQCINANAPGRLTLPTQKFPFKVKFYRSLTDCTASNVRVASYHFINGMSVGNSLSFDHHFANQTGANAMLILPTSFTKRGKSPFMAMIPRLVCGTSGAYQDCINEPDLTGVAYNAHVNVGWTSFNREQVVLKNVPITTCAETTFPTDNYFVINDCQVKDGQVKANIQRNELMCQSTPIFPGGAGLIKDVYQRNGRIFILRYESTPSPRDVLEVYAYDGTKIATHAFVSSDHTEVAANDNGDVYLSSTPVVRRLSFNVATKAFTPQTDLSLTGATKIDVSSDGLFLIAAVSTNVVSFDVGGNTQLSSVSITASDLQLVGNILYILAPGQLQKRIFNTGSGMINASPTSSFSVTSGESFYFDGTNYYVAINSTDLTIFDSLGSITATTGASGGNLTVADNKIYMSKTSTLNVYATSGLTPISNLTGTCSSSLTFQAGTLSKTLVVKAENTPNSQYIFENALRLLGRRSFSDNDRPFYFFNSLSHHDGDAGGELADAQDLLSPMGISGLFSDYSCTQLASSPTPITKSLTIVDPWSNHFGTLTVTAESFLNPMDSFICVDNDPTGSCAGAMYDLKVSYVRASGTDNEIGSILLKCGKKLGVLESLYTLSADTSRYLLLWNTESDNGARLESYEMEDSTEFSFGLVKLHKTDPLSMWSRSVSYRAGTQYSGHAMDLHRNGTDLMSRAYHISKATRAGLASDGSMAPGFDISYDAIRNMSTASGITPVSCMPVANTNVTTVANACTLNSYSDTMTSKAISMNIDTIMATDNPSDVTIRPIFTLTP